MNTNSKARYRKCFAIACALLFIADGSAVSGATMPFSVVVSSLEVPPSNASQVGTLNVYLSALTEDAIDVAGFQLSLSIAGPDDSVKFVGAGAPVGRPYIFAPNSSAPFVAVSSDGSQMTVGDFLNSGLGQARNMQGLASAQILVGPAAAGKSYQVMVNVDPAQSFLGVSVTSLLPVLANNGTVSVLPEPGTPVLAIITVIAIFAAVSGRRRSHLV